MALLLFQDDASWGAEPIGDGHRPEKTWLGQFDSPDATVLVETTLTAAIASCPDTGSCVVQLDNSIVTNS